MKIIFLSFLQMCAKHTILLVEIKTNTTDMTLVRLITANSFEDIDFGSLGNHFTIEGNEPEIYRLLDTLSMADHGTQVFYVYVETESINEVATALSNEEHPNEKEVVVNENTEVSVIEVLDEDFNVVATNLSANTGTRTHEWVHAA